MISLGPLDTIGRGANGITRLAWTPEVAEADAWFAAQAEEIGLRVERDPAGNLWACPPVDPPWWGVGSHLDSVREGGAYDGALGVVAAFEVARRTSVPVAVLSFADEEGAGFNTPTFGSRALVGRPHAVSDAHAQALGEFGVDPAALGRAPEWLERLRGFLELHIDQSTEIWDMGVPVASVSGLASRVRVHVEVLGEANHAGTTPMETRQDALRAAAELIVRATDVEPPLRATATRMLVEPNALSTIPSRVDLWLDARSPGSLDGWLEGIPGEVQSRSEAVEFAPEVRAALGGPEVVCFAGHDAGILAERIPAGMLLVRNERGVSHCAQEEVDLADAEAGVERMVRALEALA
jgi:N-carbamoyl-L-amino-acid hydrolase